MTWMNEHEVEEAQDLFNPEETPHLAEAAWVLNNYVAWVNSCSDGWPYWSRASKAADRLQTLISEHTYAARYGYYQGTARTLEDVARRDLTKAYTPVKAFLTRQGADETRIFAR